MKIHTMKITCPACPIVWEGVDENGREFYVRYRYGDLTAHYEDAPRTEYPHIPDPFLVLRHGDDLDGYMETATMLELTGFEYDGDPAEVEWKEEPLPEDVLPWLEAETEPGAH